MTNGGERRAHCILTAGLKAFPTVTEHLVMQVVPVSTEVLMFYNFVAHNLSLKPTAVLWLLPMRYSEYSYYSLQCIFKVKFYIKSTLNSSFLLKLIATSFS